MQRIIILLFVGVIVLNSCGDTKKDSKSLDIERITNEEFKTFVKNFTKSDLPWTLKGELTNEAPPNYVKQYFNPDFDENYAVRTEQFFFGSYFILDNFVLLTSRYYYEPGMMGITSDMINATTYTFDGKKIDEYMIADFSHQTSMADNSITSYDTEFTIHADLKIDMTISQIIELIEATEGETSQAAAITKAVKISADGKFEEVTEK